MKGHYKVTIDPRVWRAAGVLKLHRSQIAETALRELIPARVEHVRRFADRSPEAARILVAFEELGYPLPPATRDGDQR